MDLVRGTKHHLGKVQGINPHIQQGTSGQGRLHNALFSHDLIAQVGGEHSGLSNDARVHHLRDDLPHRLVSGPDGLGEQQALVCGPLEHLSCLLSIGGKSLLAQDMLSVLQAHHDMLIMVRVRGGHIHQLDLLVLEHLLIAAVGSLYAVGLGKLLGPFQIPGCHSIQGDGMISHLVHAVDGLRHGCGNAASSQNCHMKHLFHLLRNIKNDEELHHCNSSSS